MEGIQEPVCCDSSLSLGGEIGFGYERMSVLEKEGAFMKRGDDYVVDMESLVHVADKDLNGLSRTLSRKGSQRVEWKAMVERDASDAVAGSLGGSCNAERSVAVPLLGTTKIEPSTTATTAENRGRRIMRSSSCVSGRRSSWLDPQKVLVAFATLSSMGTIILIYFALSTANINAGDSHAQ